MANNTLFTIGYSSFSIEEFIGVLHSHNIKAVVDVRSQPYSKFYPDYNKQSLQCVLRENSIQYVFLGKELGARRDEPACYKNGRVIYPLVMEAKGFKDGIKRLLTGIDKMRVTMMCAEKDPITCHRTILICRYLMRHEIDIKHILPKGKVELQADAENRLLKLWNLDELELFSSRNEQLQKAYAKQGEKIAFVEQNEIISPEQHNRANNQ